MNKFIFTLLLFATSLHVMSQEGYPKPTNMKDVLFYIQHNRGKNTFIYALNRTDQNTLDKDEPIRVYRQLFDRSGEIRPLTGIQKNFAYGIDTKAINKNCYEVSIVSLPSQKFYLMLSPKESPLVMTTVNGMTLKVDRIFIEQKDGTSGLSTKVDYILFYGTNKNKEVVQKLLVD